MDFIVYPNEYIAGFLSAREVIKGMRFELTSREKKVRERGERERERERERDAVSDLNEREDNELSAS